MVFPVLQLVIYFLGFFKIVIFCADSSTSDRDPHKGQISSGFCDGQSGNVNTVSGLWVVADPGIKSLVR